MAMKLILDLFISNIAVSQGYREVALYPLYKKFG
jgi:hypothetical protein